MNRLAELDELEQSILNGTHEEYQERMADAEKKRMDQRRIAEQRLHLEEADIRHTFDACKKAAYDQFHVSYVHCAAPTPGHKSNTYIYIYISLCSNPRLLCVNK